MANFLTKRIQKELKKFVSSEEAGQCSIKVELLNDNFMELKGEIVGPLGTPYEGGKFELEIKVSSNYPYGPPNIRFLTKIWHPNITYATGIICSSILEQWSPALTLRHLLLWIQVILSSVQLDDLHDAEVTSQFKSNPEKFVLTARHWTKVYAGGSKKNRDFDDKIRKLTKFGLDKNESLAALSVCDWDLEYAINELLTNQWRNFKIWHPPQKKFMGPQIQFRGEILSAVLREV